MSLSRRNPRRDGNEKPIVEALERMGVVVWRVSSAGIPDLLTWYRGKWLPIDVKSKGGTLTREQEKRWSDVPVFTVESVDDALFLFGVKRPR